MAVSRRKKGTGTVKEFKDRKKPFVAFYYNKKGEKKSRSFATRKEAERFLEDISEVKELIQEGSLIVSDFVDIYLPYREAHFLKQTGFDAFRNDLRRCLPYIGKEQLINIDDVAVQDMIDSMQKDYSYASINKTKNAVLNMLKYAQKRNYVRTVPSDNFEIQKKQCKSEAETNCLSESELSEYAAECVRKDESGNFIHPSGYRFLFLLHTGIRVGEFLALTWDDYDEDSMTITIDKSQAYVNGQGKVTNSTKTNAGTRVIVLNKAAVSDILGLKSIFDSQTHLLEEAEKEKLQTADARLKKQIIADFKRYRRNHNRICSSMNFPYDDTILKGLEDTHHKICEAIGLSHRVTIHGLRHSFVTHYFLHHKNDPDFDLATFSKMIGHSNVRTTMEIYAHLELMDMKNIKRSYNELKEF